ncbi:MAG: pyridoxamine 5'-phosphate oxidase family protein [Gemmatimonadaceae bacterium]|nr:pyridoxamine 5'-phosphate oxidase family protein [Gemmatimonadaceae bacterium]
MAFTFHDRVDIEPIHYVFEDGHIFGRTKFGTKVSVLAHHPWVAFEVDEVDGLHAWQSVVVHGQIVFPTPRARRWSIGSMRVALPPCVIWSRARSSHDPTPDRDLVFCLLCMTHGSRRDVGDTAHE